MRRTIGLTLVALCAGLVALTGCSSPLAAPTPTVVVGATPSPFGEVVAAIYRGALSHTGIKIAAAPSLGTDQQLLGRLANGNIDLMTGFSGDLLHLLAPQSTAVSDGDVYKELSRALPQGVYAGDPTTVTRDQLAGRPADPSELARVLLPLYRGAVLPKKSIVGMNNVAGELNSADLAGMVADVQAGRETASDAANTWLVQHGL
ncbi:glycine betaine ABC transporter substrate-binding protein [Jongsikchunia kroppenstedtii]|uniref:glycine betaine ABC transporter substrate-binding protein n=1 Tax=Jongsikchunia kroppenstedtii TaxID=1121721 RepID=UPI000381B0D3|nr:glycine betaine ABC transporter substrate-binding protein [Jongsikchunia kroppenstedtii]